MIDRYEIVYDFCNDYTEERGIVEYFDGSWTELQEYLKQMKRNGCYNIDCNFMYSYEEVLGE